jgi:hypothetical protein
MVGGLTDLRQGYEDLEGGTIASTAERLRHRHLSRQLMPAPVPGGGSNGGPARSAGGAPTSSGWDVFIPPNGHKRPYQSDPKTSFDRLVSYFSITFRDDLDRYPTNPWP